MLHDRKLCYFKYRVLHNILACRKHLFRWKIVDSPYCILCNEIDDYQHFFIDCKRLNNLKLEIEKLLAKLGVANCSWNLKNIVIGYKINNKDYLFINIFITIVAFTIYKDFYINNCDTSLTKEKNLFNLLKYELTLRNKLLKKYALSNRMKQFLIFLFYFPFLFQIKISKVLQ